MKQWLIKQVAMFVVILLMLPYTAITEGQFEDNSDDNSDFSRLGETMEELESSEIGILFKNISIHLRSGLDIQRNKS